MTFWISVSNGMLNWTKIFTRGIYQAFLLQNKFHRSSREDSRCHLNTVGSPYTQRDPRQLLRDYRVLQRSGQGKILKRINRKFSNWTSSRVIMVRRISKGWMKKLSRARSGLAFAYMLHLWPLQASLGSGVKPAKPGHAEGHQCFGQNPQRRVGTASWGAIENTRALGRCASLVPT